MPERSQLVVVNTTPIIALALIGQLDLLRQLYGQVVTPMAVQAVAPLIGQLHHGGIRMSDAVIAEVLELADEV